MLLRNGVVTLGLTLSAVLPACPAQDGAAFHNNLLPQPKLVQPAEGAGFPVRAGMTIALVEARSPRLEAAALRAMKRLEDTTGLPMARAVSTGTSGNIVLRVGSDGAAVQGIDEDESYRLNTSAAGVTIEAATTAGALHGLETVLQLLQPEADGYVIPAVRVDDSPRFRWRGLMIDCARHFEPLPVLKRNIDAMAAVKLNVFHWHLTDDQGFRIESKLFPKLTGLGSDGRFYTQADARELVRYAHDRGIRVVPEFEMPGHSVAWLVAYPELGSGAPPSGIRREFGVSDVALDPTREETYRFIGRFLGEMATIFPDTYVHIGGDESPAPDWKTNPRIVAYMQAHKLENNEALQAHFNTRVLAILTGLHRRMVGWDEIFNPALPKDVVVQSWRGEASLAKGAALGYGGVLSAPYYLDGMKPAGEHYLADPVPSSTTLLPAQQALILGGEVCMWAEQLDERTIDSRIWPRTAAVAERFWSPQAVRDVPDMYRRLQTVSLELEALGIRHLSSEAAGLRSLAGTDDIAALSTFATAFEPVSFGERYKQQHTSQLTPLTGFVDAVVPDPPSHRRADLLVQQMTGTGDATAKAAAAAQLRAYFTALDASLPAVQALIATRPRMMPLAHRATQLAALDAIALRAVDAVLKQQRMPAAWKAASLATLKQAEEPDSIVRFTFLPALKRLLDGLEAVAAR